MPDGSVDDALRLAQQHLQAGRYADVETVCRQVLKRAPDEHGAYRWWAVAAFHAGKPEEAIDLLRQAIVMHADVAAYHENLALVYNYQKQFPEAASAARRALELDPYSPAAAFQLGQALRNQQQPAEAVRYYRQALAIKPKWLAAENGLGLALQTVGRLDEAIEVFRRAQKGWPQSIEVVFNLGLALEAKGAIDAAVEAFRTTVQLAPQLTEALHRLALGLLELGRNHEAAEVISKIFVLQPKAPGAANNLGLTRQAQGRLEEALEAYEQALRLQPTYAVAHGNSLFCRQYLPHVTPATLAAAHAEWDTQQAAKFATSWRPFDNAPTPDRKLKIGLVSGDLAQHPVGFFIKPLLQNLPADAVELTAYHDRRGGDELTAQLRGLVQNWHEVYDLGDQGLTDLVRSHNIDVLFDLAGHSGRRMLVFARRPAPVQITWAGYVGTTGLRAMDVLFGDSFHLPPGVEEHYCEQLVRLPGDYICYDPPATAPPVGPLPALESGTLTLGAFHNPAKINAEVVACWAQLLHQLPHAQLRFRYRGWDDSDTIRRVTQWFADQGIDYSRLEFLGRCTLDEMLVEYGQVDIALDPFPYSGGLTTCEALWMGVPVVTIPGSTFAGRHSTSHLHNAGLSELVCADQAMYLERVIALATDLPQLARYRSELRERVRASTLCHGPQFAQHWLAAVRQCWHDWCAQPTHLPRSLRSTAAAPLARETRP